MKSAIYTGKVYHRRFIPKHHQFTFRLFMLYLDLDELDQVFKNRFFWSTNRFNLAYFKRKDYLPDPKLSIREKLNMIVNQKIGRPIQGSVCILTHLRYFGIIFNPVSFYYCFDEKNKLDIIVAEITNTPWLERHCYVLDVKKQHTQNNFSLNKEFHISPFHPMDMTYHWKMSSPEKKITMHLKNFKNNTCHFDAILNLKRQEISGWTLNSKLIIQPFLTIKVIIGIYWQAIRLWIKKVPFYANPKSTTTDGNKQ